MAQEQKYLQSVYMLQQIFMWFSFWQDLSVKQ